MRCSAVRRDVTSVTAMADLAKNRCSRTSPPAIWAYLGIRRVQFYFEAKSDERGYSPNTAGSSYVDTGVGFFLRKLKSLSGQLNPDSRWIELAPKFDAQVPGAHIAQR